MTKIGTKKGRRKQSRLMRLVTGKPKKGKKKEVKVKSPILYAAQAAIIAMLLRFNIWLCGRRFGKTEMIVERVIDGAKKCEKMAVFVPSKDEFSDSWERLKEALKPIIRKKGIDNQKHIIRFKKGGYLKVWSLGNKGHRKNGRGFKYHKIFYEETQSIPSKLLKYHWENVARATLMDYGGECYFVGTPPNSKKHYYYKLICDGAINNEKLHTSTDIKLPEKEKHKYYSDWITFRDTAYSNPHIENSELDHFKHQLPEMIYRQEILAQCVEFAESPFILCCQNLAGQQRIFKKGLKVDWGKEIWLSFDFNKNPMACTLWQKGFNNSYIHCIQEFGAPKSKKVNIHYTCNLIKQYIKKHTGHQIGYIDAHRKIHRKCPSFIKIKVTGDATGNTDDPRQLHGKTFYEIIIEELGLTESKHLRLFTKNPPHEESHLQVNTWMAFHPHFAIDEVNCPELRQDCLNTQATAELKIDKAVHDPHFLDTLRYFFERALPRKYDYKK